MADDPLREILSSPLDADSRRPPDGGGAESRRGLPTAAWFAASMVVGALIVFTGYTLARTDAVGAPDTTTPDTTSITVPDTGFIPTLPPGFTPLDERFGARVERVLMRSDFVFVTISTVVVAGLDGRTSTPFTGGSWDLVLADGTRIPSLDQSLSRGYVTARFEAEDYGGGDILAIDLTGVALESQDQQPSSLPASVVLPDDGSTVEVRLDGAEHALDDDATLVFSDLTLSTAGGSVSWRIEGPERVQALLNVWMFARTEEGGESYLFATGGHVPIEGFWFGAQAHVLGEGMRREGTLTLSAEPPMPDGETLNLELNSFATWISYTPASVTIPIGDAPIVTIGD